MTHFARVAMLRSHREDEKLMKSLGLTKQLVVAPMAGGPSTPALVAAASEAGALGSGGMAYLNPKQIEDFAADVRTRTTKPFALNLFAPHPLPSLAEKQIARAIQATAGFRRELGLADPIVAPPFEEDFGAQFEAILRVKPAVLSWVFGLLPAECIREARKAGILLVGSATCAEEASAIEGDCDALVLQGFEAGGHRALFSPTDADPEISLAELLRTIRLRVPVIAAGGIMNSDDIRAALKTGAWAVQMGTAFLMCRESGTSQSYRDRLRGDRKTQTSRTYSGRFARGIENRFMREMPADAIMPFPQQNKFTRDLRAKSADFASLWAGTGQGRLWEESCAELIEQLFR